MDAPQIKLLRTGTFTSVEGKKVTFTDADLVELAESYDPASDPAPLVIGHPKLEDPAWGWVGKLEIADARLVATPSEIEPAFAETVRAGRYRRISPQIYERDHPANPTPGKLYLKHVGFLGAAAPAVKGLGTVSFADGADEGPLATIEATIEEISMSDKDPNAVSLAEREAALGRREAELQERETAIQSREQSVSEQLHGAHVSFAEQLVAETKLAPAGKDILVGLLDFCASAPAPAEGTISFGEGNAELDPSAALKKLLGGARPLISLGEAAAPEGDDKKLASFAAPSGYDVDPKRLEIHNRALELQSEDPNLSYLDAVKRAGG